MWMFRRRHAGRPDSHRDHSARRPTLNLARAAHPRPRKQTPFAAQDYHVGLASLCFLRDRTGHGSPADHPEFGTRTRPHRHPRAAQLISSDLAQQLVPVDRPCVAALAVRRLRNRNGDHRQPRAGLCRELDSAAHRIVAATRRLVHGEHMSGRRHRRLRLPASNSLGELQAGSGMLFACRAPRRQWSDVLCAVVAVVDHSSPTRPVLGSSAMTCTSVMGFLPRTAVCSGWWPGVRWLVCRFPVRARYPCRRTALGTPSRSRGRTAAAPRHGFR